MKEEYTGSNHAMVGDQAEQETPDRNDGENSDKRSGEQSGIELHQPLPGQDTAIPVPHSSQRETESDQQVSDGTRSDLPPVAHNQIGGANTDVTTVSTRQLMIDINIERLLPVFTGDTGTLQGIRFYLPELQEPIQITRTMISVGRADPANNIHPTLDLTRHHGLALGVSRYHAEIIFNNDKYFIKDIGSTNGTWINKRKIPPYQQIPLFSGDQIRFGHLAMVVRFLEK